MTFNAKSSNEGILPPWVTSEHEPPAVGHSDNITDRTVISPSLFGLLEYISRIIPYPIAARQYVMSGEGAHMIGLRCVIRGIPPSFRI